jgi:hypothetical protein
MQITCQYIPTRNDLFAEGAGKGYAIDILNHFPYKITCDYSSRALKYFSFSFQPKGGKSKIPSISSE